MKRKPNSLWRNVAAVFILGVLLNGSAIADSRDERLDLYFIDTEGGAATLIVAAAGESILIDSGYPDNHGRDLDRIVQVCREVAGLTQIDHAVVSHWHLDHFGNHAALKAKFGIGTFWDRGIPDELQEDPEFHNRIAAYRAASQNQSRPLKAGDQHQLTGGRLPLKVRVLTSGRDVVPNVGDPNPHAALHEPQPEDPTDNAASLSLLFSYGDFRFLTCGDLTWNVEGQLVMPNNPVGTVDLFMVTHHGLPVSNNPAMVLAIDPTVAVMCNGPTKGGAESTMNTLRKVRSLKDWYQLHRNVQLDASLQAPPEFIANPGGTNGCLGRWIKASVAADGKTYTVQIGAEGPVRTYSTRSHTSQTAK